MADTGKKFRRLLTERILVLDGAMGTMIQGLKCDEKEFRGERFANHGRPLKGCNDLLSITQPAAVEKIHRDYLKAGVDIIEANHFNANAVSLSDYGLEAEAYALNVAAARVARQAIDRVARRTPDKPHFVAGCPG